MSAQDKTAGLLAAHLFLARELAHRAHLRTKGEGSFAAHDALGDFYEALVPLTDRIVECYQGEYEVLLQIPLMDSPYEGEIRDVLKQIKSWIQDNRYRAVPKDEPTINNLIDTAIEEFQSLNFKLLYLE